MIPASVPSSGNNDVGTVNNNEVKTLATINPSQRQAGSHQHLFHQERVILEDESESLEDEMKMALLSSNNRIERNSFDNVKMDTKPIDQQEVNNYHENCQQLIQHDNTTSQDRNDNVSSIEKEQDYQHFLGWKQQQQQQQRQYIKIDNYGKDRHHDEVLSNNIDEIELRRKRAVSEPDALHMQDYLDTTDNQYHSSLSTICDNNKSNVVRRRTRNQSLHQEQNNMSNVRTVTSSDINNKISGTVGRRRAFTTSTTDQAPNCLYNDDQQQFSTRSSAAALHDYSVNISNENITNSSQYHLTWAKREQQQHQQKQQQQLQIREDGQSTIQVVSVNQNLSSSVDQQQQQSIGLLSSMVSPPPALLDEHDGNQGHDLLMMGARGMVHAQTPDQMIMAMNDNNDNNARVGGHGPFNGHNAERQNVYPSTFERNTLREVVGTGGINVDDNTDNINNSPLVVSGSEDSERLARLRWIQINRRFQIVIAIVAIMFSLLLFAILIAWVIFTSAYVVSFDKSCDVPIKPYFWLATFQLVLDVFRTDIMRLIFQWDSSSSQRIPCRVVAYNVAYLLYALLVLRLGIESVFFYDDQTSSCKETSPDLFNASVAFVTLSIAAWVTIICGYLLPFCVVACLLTCNGYNPASSQYDEIGGPTRGPAHPVFPAAYVMTGAPPDCIDHIPVITVNSACFPQSDQSLECCICMEEFKTSEVVVKTNCQHVFHKSCCREWLRQARTCPVCRSDIPSFHPSPPTGGENDEAIVGIESSRPIVEDQSHTAAPPASIPIGPTGRPVVGLFRMLQARRPTTSTTNNSSSSSIALENRGTVATGAGSTTTATIISNYHVATDDSSFEVDVTGLDPHINIETAAVNSVGGSSGSNIDSNNRGMNVSTSSRVATSSLEVTTTAQNHYNISVNDIEEGHIMMTSNTSNANNSRFYTS